MVTIGVNQKVVKAVSPADASSSGRAMRAARPALFPPAGQLVRGRM